MIRYKEDSIIISKCFNIQFYLRYLINPSCLQSGIASHFGYNIVDEFAFSHARIRLKFLSDDDGTTHHKARCVLLARTLQSLHSHSAAVVGSRRPAVPTGATTVKTNSDPDGSSPCETRLQILPQCGIFFCLAVVVYMAIVGSW